jgi:thiol-disulfide isomerase/thioredoxin/uncharacterized membrane protein YphA (DoxX/SURF4 family)
MSSLLIGIQVVLAAVLAVAGVAKLFDLSGSREAVRNFGVPARLSVPLGTALPVAELIVAVGLLAGTTARWASIAAGLLFAVFSIAIAVNLLQGRQPDCHCFGQLHSAPAGPMTLARNGGLTVLAAFVAWQGGRSPWAWLADLSTSASWALAFGVVVIAAVGAVGWLMMQLLQQNGRLLLRLEELEERVAAGGIRKVEEPARAAPVFDLPTVDGGRLTLAGLREAAKPTLLVFSDPNCGPCNLLMPDVGRWQRDLAPRMNVAVVSRGSVEQNKAKAAEHGLIQVGLQTNREVSTAYGVNGTPSAVLIQPDGMIHEPLAGGAEAIRALVARATAAPARPTIPLRQAAPSSNGNRVAAAPRGLPVGEAAPDFSLPSLDGDMVTLVALEDRETVMLFWNPGCGFCQRMLPELKAWEEEAPDDAPGLLIVSTGTPEANRALGLRSPIVLDHGFSVGRAYGSSGTPSGVAIRDGQIASQLNVGAPSVFGLLRPQPSSRTA